MKKHKFCGEIQEDWVGFSADQVYDIPANIEKNNSLCKNEGIAGKTRKT